MSYIGASPTTAAFPFDQFSGNGTTTAFTMSYAPASTTSIVVSISGVVQNPNTYSVSGLTLTFSPAPPTGTNNIGVLYLGLPVQVGVPTPGSTAQFALGSAANPSITFLGDTNTGVYSPGADTLAFTEGGTEVMRIDSSGNVGVGTTSPNSAGVGKAVTVNGVSDSILELNYGGTRGGYLYSNSTNLVLSAVNSGFLKLNTGDTERARITSGGNVLVGRTTNPDGSILNVYGAVVSTFENSQSGSAYAIIFRNPNGNIGSVTTNGSATAYNTSSDYRLKENVQPMVGALDKVAQLKPCTYTWKHDSSDGQGFIAHELQAVVPDCVTGEKDAVNEDGSIKPQGIDTSYLVATLTAALQEAHGLIKNLEARLVVLESK